MATVKALWTEDQTLTFDFTTLSAGQKGKATIDLAANGYFAVDVQLQVIYGASSDGAAIINIRSSADSGVTVDTEVTYPDSFPLEAGQTVRKTIHIREKPYVEIEIENSGNTDTITVSGKFAGLQYSVV